MFWDWLRQRRRFSTSRFQGAPSKVRIFRSELYDWENDEDETGEYLVAQIERFLRGDRENI